MSLFFLFPPQMETSEPLSTSAIDNGGNHVNVVASHRLTTVLTRPKALFLFQIPSQKERPPPMYGLGPSLGAKKTLLLSLVVYASVGGRGTCAPFEASGSFLVCSVNITLSLPFFFFASPVKEGGRKKRCAETLCHFSEQTGT